MIYVREYRSPGGEWRRIMRIVAPDKERALHRLGQCPQPYGRTVIDNEALAGLGPGDNVTVPSVDGAGEHRVRRVS